MLRKFLEYRKSYPDLLSAEAFYAPIDAFLESPVAELGFVRTGRSTWVKEDCRSARPMFELRHYKGKMSGPVWGFALNYVPHLNNSCTKLYWHRTVKSARLDVFPFDEIENMKGLSRFATTEDHEAATKQVLGTALDRATRFFDDIQSTSDLLPLFERLRRYNGDGLGYWNYTNLPLAHAFTLRVNGDYAAGKSILEKYARRFNIAEPALADLLRRFERAEADPSLITGTT